MRLQKCVKHAFNMVLHSKLRSWLTIIGIVIGVAAVVAIVSIGSGFQQELQSRLSGLGGDIITVTPGFSRGGDIFHTRGGGDREGGSATATTKEVVLSRTDVQALRGIPDIASIDTNIRGSVKATYLGKTGTVTVTGVDQKVWSQVTTLILADGRLLDAADQNVIVVGGRLAASFFSQPVGINKVIEIEGSAFRVVGIIDDQSNQIYMPIQMAYQVIPNHEQEVYDSLVVKIRNEDTLNETLAKIEQKLIAVRHVTATTKDFSVTSSKLLQQTRAQTLQAMNIFLLALAAVSLIVGAVGVANTMFTSVIEKTKEIGIMKAIGAQNKDILLIFLFNAAFIGLVGGVIGIIIGAILSGLLPTLLGAEAPQLHLSTIVTLNSVLMAISVSVIVGVVAGSIPAYQASKLKPVDALRYE